MGNLVKLSFSPIKFSHLYRACLICFNVSFIEHVLMLLMKMGEKFDMFMGVYVQYASVCSVCVC